jgi:hypothetical protein
VGPDCQWLTQPTWARAHAATWSLPVLGHVTAVHPAIIAIWSPPASMPPLARHALKPWRAPALSFPHHLFPSSSHHLPCSALTTAEAIASELPIRSTPPRIFGAAAPPHPPLAVCPGTGPGELLLPPELGFHHRAAASPDWSHRRATHSLALAGLSCAGPPSPFTPCAGPC